MTIIVRLAMSPVTYKSYVSQIKMKVLKPEVDVITNKYKDDAVKRQQETMALYNKAGANPMSGCLPALLQLPVFYALFSFFPVAFALRQKSFCGPMIYLLTIPSMNCHSISPFMEIILAFSPSLLL